ncbi:hypothetical protein [Corynebacterium sp. CCUG 70398]|uniref:hypothetical protein n=1 Tax=Corynebacterium sp. CCUG 70398 TaxID=2823891 RepID=UPI00210DE71A|nr:hypothetical protein [Corynebacterium sp. CCUG 70398]MCQ4622410.1 hypothetical protein [Corynebacterium sp. CCUG 70398]
MGNALVKDRLNAVAQEAAALPGVSSGDLNQINAKVSDISAKLDYTNGKDTSALPTEAARVNPKGDQPGGKSRPGGRSGGWGIVGLLVELAPLAFGAINSAGDWLRDIGITGHEDDLDEGQRELDRCLEDLRTETGECVNAVDEIDSNAEDGVLAILDTLLKFLPLARAVSSPQNEAAALLPVVKALMYVEKTIDDRNESMRQCYEHLESLYDEVGQLPSPSAKEYYPPNGGAPTSPEGEPDTPKQTEQPEQKEPPVDGPPLKEQPPTGATEAPVKPAGPQAAPAPEPAPGPAPVAAPAPSVQAAPPSAESVTMPTIPASVATEPAGFTASAGGANLNVNINVGLGGDLGGVPPAPAAPTAPPVLPTPPSLPAVPPVGPVGQAAIGQFIAGVEEFKNMVMDCLSETELPPAADCECPPEAPETESDTLPEKPAPDHQAPEKPAPENPATEQPATEQPEEKLAPPPELAEVKEPPPPPKQSVAPAGAGELGQTSDATDVAPEEPHKPAEPAAPHTDSSGTDTGSGTDTNERTRKTRTW